MLTLQGPTLWEVSKDGPVPSRNRRSQISSHSGGTASDRYWWKKRGCSRDGPGGLDYLVSLTANGPVECSSTTLSESAHR